MNSFKSSCIWKVEKASMQHPWSVGNKPKGAAHQDLESSKYGSLGHRAGTEDASGIALLPAESGHHASFAVSFAIHESVCFSSS